MAMKAEVGNPATCDETACAKLNLYLHVTGRRDDGYHLLDSLVVFADCCDRLSFRPAEGLTLTVSGPFAAETPGGEENLVMTAARRLAVAADVPAGAAIQLQKNLPVAAGIGGGSADAAACLRGLTKLWNVDLPRDELAALALSLGADVPVCLASEPAHLSGIGEQVSVRPAVPALPLILVNPGIALATAEVFAARRGGYTAAAADVPEDDGIAAFCRWLEGLQNSLEGAAVSLAPEVGRVLDVLSSLPGCLLARMSGSGATCFAIFADDDSRDTALAVLRGRMPEWWAVATRSRAPVRRAA
jgi:4-diphosphocytidyl-2-C-methyl-D-erythritol kinase